ncbi:MAG: DUF2961 domain-containing protein [Firmicutes bacterium]|nr:DUF2961 domain-containing protein [Bacillota bacterium]
MDLQYLSVSHDIETISFSAENVHGEKGKGAMDTEGVAASSARDLGKGWKISPFVYIEAGETKEIAKADFQGAIKHIWMTIACELSRSLILRIYWDDSSVPSVEVPLCDFFCSAIHQSFKPLSSLAVCVNPSRGYNSYFEMPFFKGFRITVENLGKKRVTLYYQIDAEKKKIPENSLYFHAQFHRTNPLPYKEVYTILDQVQGRGQYVGTYMLWGVNQNGWWGEGEIKFYLDGDQEYPSICGTGTEDYFCGAYNFDVNGRYFEFSTPYSGMYKIEPTDETYLANRRFNLYRWHIVDPVYFKENIRVTIQALGWRSDGRYLARQDDISSVAYYYLDRINEERSVLPDMDDLEII